MSPSKPGWLEASGSLLCQLRNMDNVRCESGANEDSRPPNTQEYVDAFHTPSFQRGPKSPSEASQHICIYVMFQKNFLQDCS